MSISFSHEPAIWIGAITALLAIGTAFGLPVTPAQRDTILASLPVLAAVIVAIRSQVTPTAKVEAKVAEKVNSILQAPVTTPNLPPPPPVPNVGPISVEVKEGGKAL